jgi:hypothetical protein
MLSCSEHWKITVDAEWSYAVVLRYTVPGVSWPKECKTDNAKMKCNILHTTDNVKIKRNIHWIVAKLTTLKLNAIFMELLLNCLVSAHKLSLQHGPSHVHTTGIVKIKRNIHGIV